MTNDEIIKFLQSKQIPQCGDKAYTADEEYEAYQRAIDALERQPCDDAIRRDAAIKTVHKMRVVCDTEDIDDYYELLVESFKQLPPVTQKYGKWIDYSDEGFIECPFCGHATNCEDNIDELHYCFYCGARMVEPQESEDKE